MGWSSRCQVIQALTLWSPIVGGHEAPPLSSGHVFTHHPKKVTFSISRWWYALVYYPHLPFVHTTLIFRSFPIYLEPGVEPRYLIYGELEDEGSVVVKPRFFSDFLSPWEDDPKYDFRAYFCKWGPLVPLHRGMLLSRLSKMWCI